MAKSQTTETNSNKLDAFLAPSAFKVFPGYIRVGDQYARTIFLATYPRYLHTSWFSPIINLDRVFDISIYINPKNTAQLLKQLRDQLARLEAQVMEESAAGKVRNPILETAIQDIESLRDKLQQGTDRFFELGVYVTFYENSLQALDETENKLKGLLEYQLIFSRPATFRMSEGFMSTLPLGSDKLNVYTSLNTEPLSSVFPFVSFDLTSNSGILYGINTHNNSLVLFDRFGLENANAVVFGKSGGGKSILGSEPVMIQRNGQAELKEIGPLIEEIIAEKGINQLDKELEGVIAPGIEIWGFDKKMRASWSKVTVAARKKATHYFYRFTTKSGRTVTTTSDHNMVIIKNGVVVNAKSSEIKVGDSVPLPRQITPSTQPTQSLNLLDILQDSKNIYIDGVKDFIDRHYQLLTKQKINEKFDRYLYKYRRGRAIPIQYFLKILDRLGINKDNPVLNNVQVVSKNGKGSLPIYFPVKESFLKILGYIASEGTVTDKIIVISNTDEKVLLDISQTLTSLGVLFFSTDRSIVIGDVCFVRLVQAIDGKRRSAEKRVIPLLFNSDQKSIAAYLKAYFEGDGGVEHASVTATSKSKELISGICYLLYLFGIVGRIRQTHKKAPGWTTSKLYWKLAISGNDNLTKFYRHINFLSIRKQKLLSSLLTKKQNTNVDTIPQLQSLFKEISLITPFLFSGIHEISSIKRGSYNPSPRKLLVTIGKMEERIFNFRKLNERLKPLNLPNLDSIIKAGENKMANQRLWQQVGQSWRLFKQRTVTPKTSTVLKILNTLDYGYKYSLADIKKSIYTGFQTMSLPVKYFDRSLQVALVGRPNSDTSYQMIYNAARHLTVKYLENTKKVERVQHLVSILKTFAQSDLFWDPIAKIEKIKNKKEKYVYDLTVDNEVFLAGTGGLFVHNSYTIKLEILRSLVFGTQVLTIDPEDEYKYLAETVGGSSIKISVNSPHHLNPFDLPVPKQDEPPADVFKSHTLNLTGLFRLLMGDLTPEETNILDEAIIQTYAIKDITPESDFTKAEPPILSDFQNVLEGLTGAESMAVRLKKYTQGTFSGFLNNPTNVALDNRFVVFSIRDMEEELRPIAMYLILNHIWTQVRRNLKKRILVVDEAWWLMKYPIGADFLFNIAKRARKYYLGLTTITQDIPDFMATPQGSSIVANSSMQVLMKQSPSTIEVVKKTFNLTDAEKYYLLEARVGFGLFFIGQNHIGIRVVASYAEDQIITSDPRQILEVEKAKEEWAKTQV